MREAARATKTPNPLKKEPGNLKMKKEKAQGWQRGAKMATVGRARQMAESLINRQLPHALYGKDNEKDIDCRQSALRALAVREPDRSHAMNRQAKVNLF